MCRTVRRLHQRHWYSRLHQVTEKNGRNATQREGMSKIMRNGLLRTFFAIFSALRNCFKI